MFATFKITIAKMNRLSKNILADVSHLMGCNDSMMSMSMIMR